MCWSGRAAAVLEVIGVLAIAVGGGCTSATPPLATAQPGVIYAYPADGQRDVPLGARVVVTFSDPVVAGALGACTGSGDAVRGGLCLVGPDGPITATPAVVGDGRTVELGAASLASGTAYALYVDPALAPDAHNLPASGPLVRFTTRSVAPSAAAPAVIAVNGADPATPEAYRPLFETSTIRLVFSEPLDPRTVVLGPGAIELVDLASGRPVPATLLASGIHVAIDPIADLTPGRAYQLRLGAALADQGGQRVAPVTYPLTPRATGAASPIAELLRVKQPGDPGAAGSHAGADRNVITIDKPLVGREQAQVQPSTLAVELGDPQALGGPIAFTIRRGQRIRASGLDVKLGGEIPIGLATGDVWIELLTDGGGRIYRNPWQPADQRPENARAPLAVDLSMDVAVFATDPTGNAVLSQTVLGVQASGVAIAEQGVLDLEAVIAMDLTLLGVARAPTNLSLGLITDPAAAAAPDRTPPSLVAILPAVGELAVDSAVDLIFSEPIDLDRARAGGVALETAAGQPVATTLALEGAALVIRPIAPLAYGQGYRIALRDVADRAGNALAAVAPIAVQTPALAATSTPLTVAAVYPGAPCALTGATATSPGRCASGDAGDDRYHPFSLPGSEPVRVVFTQPPAAATVVHGTACGAGSVRVEELTAAGACVRAVAGSFSAHDRTLAFLPAAPWQRGTRYRLTVVSGGDRRCDAGELCSLAGAAASFDPLFGSSSTDGGGPDLVIDFVGAPATDGTLVFTEAGPATDANGSGTIDGGERLRDDNRAALRIVGTGGVISSASFRGADCLPGTAAKEACMYLSGALPVELMPVSHTCPLPGGEQAASCVPVVVTPQVMYATSVGIDATALVGISTDTGLSVMRLREPAGGPATGYLIDDHGTPTFVIALGLYLDAPDMSVPLSSHDLHSKPLAIVLRGPMRFLPDGRIAIAVANTADVPVTVTIDATVTTGQVRMIVPKGELRLQLVSGPLRGGLP